MRKAVDDSMTISGSIGRTADGPMFTDWAASYTDVQRAIAGWITPYTVFMTRRRHLVIVGLSAALVLVTVLAIVWRQKADSEFRFLDVFHPGVIRIDETNCHRPPCSSLGLMGWVRSTTNLWRSPRQLRGPITLNRKALPYKRPAVVHGRRLQLNAGRATLDGCAVDGIALGRQFGSSNDRDSRATSWCSSFRDHERATPRKLVLRCNEKALLLARLVDREHLHL